MDGGELFIFAFLLKITMLTGSQAYHDRHWRIYVHRLGNLAATLFEWAPGRRCVHMATILGDPGRGASTVEYR